MNIGVDTQKMVLMGVYYPKSSHQMHLNKISLNFRALMCEYLFTGWKAFDIFGYNEASCELYKNW